jgi:hypothetical protein
MAKRTREEEVEARGRAEAEMMVASSASASAAVECEFCHQPFKPRGLKIHQSRCKAKVTKREPPPPHQQLSQHDPDQHEQQEPKYRFRIGDEHVFDHLLSFLSNQSQTKLQLVTGDRYTSCEPLLSRYCCACEEDNPALFDGLCSACATAKRNYKPLITKTEAKTQYGLKDLTGVPCDVRRKYTLYARADLDRHAVTTFGSRRAWLRSLAQHDSRVKKLAATKKQKRDEHEAFLQTLSPAFATYAKFVDLKAKPKSELENCSSRFTKLTTALKQRGLQLRMDSRLCEEYIASGNRMVDEVVDTMEEMAFLFKHTKYSARSRANIREFREQKDGWYPRELYNAVMQSCRDEAKADLCVEYLLGSTGLTLPRKWEKCCARLEEVRTVGNSPTAESWYIYTGPSSDSSDDDY